MIKKWIRPKQRLPPPRRRNVLWLLKEYVKSEDPVRFITRAMRAVINAVHLDAGDSSQIVVAKVMMELRLLIREKKPIEQQDVL